MRKAVKHAQSLEPQKLKTAPKWKEQDADEFIYAIALAYDIQFEN